MAGLCKDTVKSIVSSVSIYDVLLVSIWAISAGTYGVNQPFWGPVLGPFY